MFMLITLKKKRKRNFTTYKQCINLYGFHLLESYKTFKITIYRCKMYV